MGATLSGASNRRSDPKKVAPPPMPRVVPLRADALSAAALVAGARAGDRASCLELYRRHAADAERMLVRVCGFVPDMADLLHDVFVRVFEGIGSLRKPDSVRSWIMGIAIRRAREHLRARSRTRPVAELEVAGAGGEQEAALELQRVYALLQRLDHDDRVAFVLRRIEGMDLAEISEVCEVSLATTKRRIARADAAMEAWVREDPVLRDRLEGRPS
jgi:RNA polymerase sigma-70 factor (ECF subfamily)